MGLLLISAGLLSFGYQDFANDVAIYAFYSLVLGVALQIASYVKYGETKETEKPGHMPVELPSIPAAISRRKLALGLVAVLLIVGGIAVFLSYNPQLNPLKPHYAQLTATVVPSGPIKEPDGSTIILFSLNVMGGALPYTFTAQWSDGVNQTSSAGIFQRSFAAGQALPSFAIVTVTSSDSQVARVNVTVVSK